MPILTYLEAIRRAMCEEMERDEHVFVLGEDIGKGGVLNATKGMRDRFGERRVLDTPLAESAIVGVAIGAAMVGMRPIAEIQFADFVFSRPRIKSLAKRRKSGTVRTTIGFVRSLSGCLTARPAEADSIIRSVPNRYFTERRD